MEKNWEKNLSVYIKRTISPDGRDTIESTQALSERMFEFASVKTCNHSFLIFYPLSE